MPAHFTGGCVCGAIRYECTAEPTLMFLCHCRDCQRSSGGPYAPVVYLPARAFKLTRGTLHHYDTPGTVGAPNHRGFCRECGSSISGAKGAGGIGVNASSLDDPSWFRPQLHMWAADAQPWDHLDPNIPQFDQYPPAT